jgi:hypothetical protein
VTAISSYARALAVAQGRAQPIATRRHVHVAGRPLVFVPLTLAGEANAPVAALVGTEPDAPRLLVVPQPRSRDLRFAFAAELAGIVLAYVESCVRRGAEVARDRLVYYKAPQLLVPTTPGLTFVRLFGRSTRFRRPTGPYPVPVRVPLLGRWLTYFAERAEHPGASGALAMTQALGLHWATGQSAVEDANLAALLAWIEPPPGRDGASAARDAEDPLRTPPAGPNTDPLFDTAVLAPAIRAYAAAEDDPDGRRHAQDTIEQALRGQLENTWRLMWQGVELLRQLPPGESVAARWYTEREKFSAFYAGILEGRPPQARRDGAVAAARRLNDLESAQADYDAARALDDPLVMADHRVTGEAFAGTVTAVVTDRRIRNDTGRLVTRPLVTVRTEDPVRLAEGTTVIATARRKQECAVVRVEGGQVLLEVRSGIGRTKVPPPDALPRPGDALCYTSVILKNFRSPQLPSVDATPWTHGGPPPAYVPTDEDAIEVWE